MDGRSDDAAAVSAASWLVQRVPGSCVETTNHSVVVYRTEDLSTWEYLGEAIRAPRLGIEYRPHVVWNARTQRFVMWCTSTEHQQSVLALY